MFVVLFFNFSICLQIFKMKNLEENKWEFLKIRSKNGGKAEGAVCTKASPEARKNWHVPKLEMSDD